MNIVPLCVSDLTRLPTLQPDGWGNIILPFTFYLSHTFCHPIGIVDDDDDLVGVGSCIVHHNTAWLCHIIVHPERRNQGIGKRITDELISIAGKYPEVKSLLLIATQLGAPVYRKAGFAVESEYNFFKGEAITSNRLEKPVPAEPHHFDEILQLDRQVSGEDRVKILSLHRDACWVELENNKVDGFYFPTLGDGLIIAKTSQAGQNLMGFRAQRDTRFVIPEQNVMASELLQRNGYELFLKGTRMRLGKKIPWQPERLFNRIGGNLG